MIRAPISVVVLITMGMTIGPSEAQYRVKPRFPWVPQQGSATSNAFVGQNRGAHFNPKELKVDRKANWQKGRRYGHEGGMFFGRGTRHQNSQGGVTGFTRKVIGVRK
jgi:hypothetical protein